MHVKYVFVKINCSVLHMFTMNEQVFGEISTTKRNSFL